MAAENTAGLSAVADAVGGFGVRDKAVWAFEGWALLFACVWGRGLECPGRAARVGEDRGERVVCVPFRTCQSAGAVCGRDSESVNE